MDMAYANKANSTQLIQDKINNQIVIEQTYFIYVVVMFDCNYYTIGKTLLNYIFYYN